MYKLVIALIALSTLFGSEAIARSEESWICLRNDTMERKLILVEDIDNHDWDGVSRPDHNWHGTYIRSAQTICERAEVNDRTRSQFTFIINGRDGPHKVRMQFGFCNDGGCEPWEGNGWRSLLTTSDVAQSILRGSRIFSEGRRHLQIGYPCDAGSQCKLFKIQDVP